MSRLVVILTSLLLASSAMAANGNAPKKAQDPFFGQALYYAYQGEWFDAIARLDTELGLYHGLDEPELDPLYAQANLAEFDVGDFELAYRMHQRAGRAIKAVIEGNVAEPVRNNAIFRLARIYFQKDQPQNALHAIERIKGTVPAKIVNDLAFLRAQILMANGRFGEAVGILQKLLGVKELEGFASYNLGVALMKSGEVKEGRKYLDFTGKIVSEDPVTLAIKDKANLVLGDKMLEGKNYEGAKAVLDRIRLTGPFSDRALLGSGWADASRKQYARALVPWSLLIKREVTDSSVQEAMIAVPYAYGKLGVYSQAALMYGRALKAFGGEIDKLTASIKSIREGNFLRALVRPELKQDANWVVKLRELPETPETYYLLDLMASNDFQESLKNYLDLDELRKKLQTWAGDLDAYEEMIEIRRAYYQPLLPTIDSKFRRLDSQMRLRLEQRDRIDKRLHDMLVAPRPDYLETAPERLLGERLARLKQRLTESGAAESSQALARIKRLRGVLDWKIYTEYDKRLTLAYKNLHELNQAVDLLRKRYNEFVRFRQAATQSYEGYGDEIRRLRIRIAAARVTVGKLMARQGHMLEVMALNVLTARRDKLEEYQVKARFAMADSYDRATRAQGLKGEGP